MAAVSLQKGLTLVLVVTCVFCLAAAVYLDIHYAYTMPRSAQPETGRIYPLCVSHGTVVYVNQRELRYADFVFHDLMTLFGIGAILGFVLKFRWKALR